MTEALSVEEQQLEAPHSWMATWMAWVLLAMESHDKATGIEFDVERFPPKKAAKLKKACLSGAVMVSVPDPEPYSYLTLKVCGTTLRVPRGVVIGRRASHYKAKKKV